MSNKARKVMEQVNQGEDPKEVITEMVSEGIKDGTLDMIIKDNLVELASQQTEVRSAWEEFMPPVDGGRSINAVIAQRANQLAPNILVEFENYETGAVEQRSAQVKATQHNEKVYLDVEMERQGHLSKSYADQYSQQMFEGEFLERVGEAIEQHNLWNQFNEQKMVDAYDERGRSGRIVEPLPTFFESVADAVSDKAREQQDHWAQRYLDYIDRNGAIVQ